MIWNKVVSIIGSIYIILVITEHISFFIVLLMKFKKYLKLANLGFCQ